jgi:hypothetical protein
VSSPGNELLGHMRAAAVEMVGALAHPDADQLLAGLGDAPDAWKGHALDGQLLDRIDGAALGAAVQHAGAAAMIRRLAALIGQSDAVGLFGREVGGRRLPVVAVQGGAGPTRLVALAGPRADGQPGVEVVVAGTTPAPIEASPAGGVHLTVAGNAPDPFTVTMPESGPAGLTGSAPGAELRLEVDLDPPPEAAPPEGPDIRRESVHVVFHLRADQPAPAVDLAVGEVERFLNSVRNLSVSTVTDDGEPHAAVVIAACLDGDIHFTVSDSRGCNGIWLAAHGWRSPPPTDRTR